MRIQVSQADIIRVQYTNAATIPSKTSLCINKLWPTPTFSVSEDSSIVTITTSRIKAKVTKSNGSISYTDLNDNVILSEDSANSKALTAVTVEGVATNKVESWFSSPANEALFGLGQTQDSVMNRKGTTLHMLNGNMWIYIPMLVSNKGYGIFWDNCSTTDFYGNESSNTRYHFASECGDMVDYYFFYGPGIDRVVALYRTATGAAPMFPKWAYGLFQSKDKYTSQTELLNVKNGYRNASIPLDCIVQDWDYWTPYTWGSHFMDESRYSDPASLMSQFHSANIHGMISIWPEYEYTSSPKKTGDQDNYNALNNIGALYTSGGTHHFYDTFNANARTLVYQQIYDRLVGKYGWDGIWADNTEPQPYPDSVNVRAANTALGKGALNINAYPLQHSKALYEGWRSVGPNTKRVYVLTRSAYGGQQRYATTCWSGDIDSNFTTFPKQIPAGLNFTIAGIPYWTTDIGGYWGHSVDWTTSANNELFTRWFQYGAFCPIFRIHGGGSRELYGSQWSATTKANLLAIDNLRYRLMPYIYSLAWKVTNEGYTMMRPLVFDYQNDTNVYNIKDQFLFGPAILVNPVTSAGVTSRNVYLPSGTWYDFWTGATKTGGGSSSVSAPLNQIPLFVKAGSIVPMGPNIQYATQSIDPLEIRVYKGQNGSFTLYEDEGDTYNYESGQYSTIEFTWDEAAQVLSIGARSGSYSGMPANRTFNIVFVSSNHGIGGTVTTADLVINYTGAQVGQSPEPTAVPTIAPTPGPTGITNGSISIACGSSSAVGSFQPDQYYSGGTAYNNTNTIDVSQMGSNPPPAELFNNERFGAMSYTISGFIAGSSYLVTLYFAETYLASAGSRLFNVSVNGAAMLSSFDIYASAGGQNKAIARSYTTTADGSGQIVIQFTAVTENPKINGISITPNTNAGTLGDVNGSGTVDIVDALLVAQYYVGLSPAGFVAANADVNCSGGIDIVDALLVAQYYVGLISSFPC
jgi:alpha-D-xyloside xylohydrolase